MPFPQLLNEIRAGLPAAPGVPRHLVLSDEPRAVQMFPIEQGENSVTAREETGDLRESSVNNHDVERWCETTDMMKPAAASQVEVDNGQQTGFELVREHPAAQS